MPKLAANLSHLFPELPLEERFGAAAAAGFEAVEILFPYATDASALARLLAHNGLTQALINMPPGDWQAGDRGLAGLPDRRHGFAEAVARTSDYAAALGCRTVHCMAGHRDERFSRREQIETYVENLRFACVQLGRHGITVTIEPINTHDVPGYLLSRTDAALAIIERVGEANLALQFDVYHSHMMGEDPAALLAGHMDAIAHIQVSDAPGRHEPGSGEIDYGRLLPLIDTLGYRGWVGCEYSPAGATIDGLSWAAPYLRDPGNG